MNRIITVIPVYNGARFLGATLESVARQTVPPDRLIVLDDCSTDGTRDLVKGFNGLPCELQVNEKRLGLFGNLNRALTLARETVHLHILLADDLILPRFFERILPALGTVRGPALAYSLTESIDEKGHRLSERKPNTPPGGIRRVGQKEFTVRQGELQTVFCGSIVLKTDGEPSPVEFRMDMPQTADCVFYADLAAHCTERIEVREVLCQIRHHPYSATSTNVRSIQAWVLDEWKAMEIIFNSIEESAWQHWVRRQRLQCLFAARSHVKVATTRQQSPEFAREIRAATLSVVAPHHWLLGKLAVAVRDGAARLRGSPSVSKCL